VVCSFHRYDIEAIPVVQRKQDVTCSVNEFSDLRQWLDTLHLSQYEETFQKHNYSFDMVSMLGITMFDPLIHKTAKHDNLTISLLGPHNMCWDSDS
jgi:hypothetical protein